nr:ABC transporter ATP-binding protein [uncultured Acetatifactor sp.]
MNEFGKDTYMNSVNRKKNTATISATSRQNARSASGEFAPILRRVCIAAWILKLIPIPIGLWNARLLSRTVTGAVSGDSESVLRTGAVLLLLLALTKAFDFATCLRYRKAASQALHRCRLLLYRRFLSCPLSALYGMEHGQAVELLNDDFDTVTGKPLRLYPGFFTGLATFVAYFAFLLARNLQTALALFAISLLQALPPILAKGFAQQNYSDTRDIEADITDLTLELYHGFDTIKMFGLKQWCLDRLAGLHRDYLKIGNRSEATATAEGMLNQLIGNILTYGTYGLMGWFILQGYAELDAGVEAIALSGGLYAAAKSIFETIPSFAVARTADRRMAALYQETCGAVAPGDSGQSQARETGIRLDDVSYSFGDRQILSRVRLSIPVGQISVIRGANGMGKSTLLKLILGMLIPDTGVITIHGTPSPALPRDSFPGRFFFLPQEDAAFHISAEELYAMVPGVEPEAALAFAALFSLPEESLAQPIDTLSGGQRKKVFLALAFAARPEWMLLDEPGNSLDAESRDILAKLLRERSGGTVIVTHDAAFDGIADAFYTFGNASGQCMLTVQNI